VVPARVSGDGTPTGTHALAHTHAYTQADPHLLLRSRCHTSVGNASPPSGPFSQALARALVPHLSDTSGITRHPRRRCYESLGTPRGRLPPRKIASVVCFCYSPSGYRVAERYLLISNDSLSLSLSGGSDEPVALHGKAVKHRPRGIRKWVIFCPNSNRSSNGSPIMSPASPRHLSAAGTNR